MEPSDGIIYSSAISNIEYSALDILIEVEDNDDNVATRVYLAIKKLVGITTTTTTTDNGEPFLLP